MARGRRRACATLQEIWLDALTELRWQTRRDRRRLQGAREQGLRRASWKIDDVRVAIATATDSAASKPAAARRRRPKARRRRRRRPPPSRTSAAGRCDLAAASEQDADSPQGGDDAALAAIFGDGRHARRAPCPASASARSSSTMAQAVAQAIATTRPARGRGRHRHRQDLRLSGAGAAVGRQGDHLDRHQEPAGPAVPARPADGARCAEAPVSVALLKGRANYVCHYHLERARVERLLQDARGCAASAKIVALRQGHARAATRAGWRTCRRTRRSGCR